MHRASLILIASGLVVACGTDPAPAIDASVVDAVGPDAMVDGGGPDARPPTFGGARPATLLVPTSYDPSTPTPLVIVLHGYSNVTTYPAAAEASPHMTPKIPRKIA